MYKQQLRNTRLSDHLSMLKLQDSSGLQTTSDGSSEIAFGRSCPHIADVDEDQGVIDHQIGRLDSLQR